MEISGTLLKAWEETGKTEFIKLLEDTLTDDLTETIESSKFRDLWENAYESSENKKKVLICADERVMPNSGEFKVGTAGQLILESEKHRDNFIKAFKGKIKAVRSHSGCGAARIAYSKMSEEKKNNLMKVRHKFLLSELDAKEMSEADLYGAYHSSILAKKLGAKFEHISFSRMLGNKGFHAARIIFWSTDPSFDPSMLSKKFIPPHFLSNGMAFGLNEDYCKEELKILSGIALGDHGFGKIFGSGNPFYVISVGKNPKEAKKLNELSKKALREFGNRVQFKLSYLSS